MSSNETRKKADELFQSAKVKAVSLAYRFDSKKKRPHLCGQQMSWNNISSETIKEYW